MSCGIWRELASGRLDDALWPEESRALEAHQALCRECAEQDRQLVSLRSLLANCDSAPLSPPDDLDDRLFARIEADRTGPLGRFIRAVASIRPRHRLVPSASAAVLLLAVALYRSASYDYASHANPVGSALARTAPASIAASDPATLLAAARSPARDSGFLTVWDSSAETIVASIDPSGLAGHDAVRSAGHRPPPRSVDPRPRSEVRLFLFERIVVTE